jgi:hypothetical protein
MHKETTFIFTIHTLEHTYVKHSENCIDGEQLNILLFTKNVKIYIINSKNIPQ